MALWLERRSNLDSNLTGGDIFVVRKSHEIIVTLRTNHGRVYFSVALSRRSMQIYPVLHRIIFVVCARARDSASVTREYCVVGCCHVISAITESSPAVKRGQKTL